MNTEQAASVDTMLRLDGDTVLVTGASGNIGGGIAARLAEAGAEIVAHFHGNRASAEALIERIGAGTTICADLSDERAVGRLFAECRPDCVVNNAAAQPVKDLEDMSAADWRAVQAANLDSAFLVTRRAVRAWRAAGSAGRIVNIASIEATDPASGHAHYATSKAGLLMFTRACALEFGEFGIRVNAVSPGLIDRDGLANDWPDGVRRWQAKAPLKRLGTPNDVADAVLFLLSSAARWITGVNLVVDGGMSAQNKW